MLLYLRICCDFHNIFHQFDIDLEAKSGKPMAYFEENHSSTTKVAQENTQIPGMNKDDL